MAFSLSAMAVPELDPGLVIFIRRLPTQVIEALLKSRLQPFLSSVHIPPDGYDLHKTKARGVATLFVKNRQKGEEFLELVTRSPTNLRLSRFIVEFQRNDVQDGGAMLRDRKFIQEVEANAHTKVNLEDHMQCKSLS